MNRFEEDFPSLKGVPCNIMSEREAFATRNKVGDPIYINGLSYDSPMSRHDICIPSRAIQDRCIDKARVREAINEFKQHVREAIDEEFGCHCVDEEVECWGCKIKNRLNL